MAKMHQASLLRLNKSAFVENRQSISEYPKLNNNLATKLSESLPSLETSTDFEDLLLLTHGCSSYHHYRNLEKWQCNKVNDSDFDEAEF